MKNDFSFPDLRSVSLMILDFSKTHNLTPQQAVDIWLAGVAATDFVPPVADAELLAQLNRA